MRLYKLFALLLTLGYVLGSPVAAMANDHPKEHHGEKECAEHKDGKCAEGHEKKHEKKHGEEHDEKGGDHH